MDPKYQRVKLNDGHFIPILGFGTYAPEEVPKSEALEVTQLAIEVGFRHIDCAHLYQNEGQVGQAIRSKIADGTVKREDIFYTSKLWSTFLQPELVRPALEKSLKNVQLDYVDLYIIHFPLALKPGEELFPKDENGKMMYDSVDLCRTWEALEKCKDAGLAKSIGVSNFNHKQLEKILNKPGLKYKPVCNQGEPELPYSFGGPGSLCHCQKAQANPSSGCPSLPDTTWGCGSGQELQQEADQREHAGDAWGCGQRAPKQYPS
ncbi:dihydrodiol dehydrogenase 3-like isoform X2 [Ovis aries]|uniref:dihydrodiol dehydrogenase 3-like isoform X2 n=1 Tax=Ovis aries TaxID=9940 RepID=UPI0029528037|nr:dihydrodiol dehydrogenase 3-like isoform X2 [Ovis aries]XP_060253546.1 dihydrodiol dehydrogenase 3-like isoform X2 [Ovis aries]